MNTAGDMFLLLRVRVTTSLCNFETPDPSELILERSLSEEKQPNSCLPLDRLVTFATLSSLHLADPTTLVLA